MLTESLKGEINLRYKRLKESRKDFVGRRSQLLMIAAVARGFTSEAKAIAIEAPTGTGKSLAYLIGGLPSARAMEKKLLLSTNTIALQEQLQNKDIPEYLAATGDQAKVMICKGRGRYACLALMQRLTNNDDAQEALDLGDDAGGAVWPRKPRPGEPERVARLFTFAMEKKWDGDLDNAPEPVDAELAAIMSTTAGGCSNQKCRFYNACPFINARRNVKDADIIVTNHSLLLADLNLRNGEDEEAGGVILPKPSSCLMVLDEAHHIGPKAVEQDASQVHVASTARNFTRAVSVMRAAYSSVAKEKIGGLSVEEGIADIEAVKRHLLTLQQVIQDTWVPSPEDQHPQWRASLGQIPDSWREIAVELSTLCTVLLKWFAAVRRAALESDRVSDGARERLAREIGIAKERLQAQADVWSVWALADAAGRIPYARWVTLGNDHQIICHASSVSAAARLRENLFGQAAGVVLTSATLSAGGNFGWLAASVGLPAGAERVSLPSPFDLERQAAVVIPSIRAVPSDREAHVEEITRWLTESMDWSLGNLVLFTSKAKLEAVYGQLPAQLREHVLVQGAQSRRDMLKRHEEKITAGQGSTLFGMQGLAEGTDLKGKLLETCVITQIPFAVPTDPVGATYAEWLESQRRNPFAEVAIPDATRLLIQYCGRLIRTETDTGQIVILDRRLTTQRYGKRMLDALPPFRRVIEPQKQVIPAQ